jgi:hypothetical protein
MLSINVILLVLALACFATEAVRARSVIALGLACWVLAQLLGRV